MVDVPPGTLPKITARNTPGFLHPGIVTLQKVSQHSVEMFSITSRAEEKRLTIAYLDTEIKKRYLFI